MGRTASQIMLVSLLVPFVAALSVARATVLPAGAAVRETVLYAFAGEPSGGGPVGDIVMDAAGSIYGTTEVGGEACFLGCGTVYRLIRQGLAYVEQDLYVFTDGLDGSVPLSGLVSDHSGALYGTTFQGGIAGAGSVFKLTPTASGYAMTTLYDFRNKGDGACPYVGLTIGPHGELFGTTQSGGPNFVGTAFELVPGRSGYRERLLHTFGSGKDGTFPESPLTAGAHGTLYGTTDGGGTYNQGTVYALTPSPSGYIETILYSFSGTKLGRDGSGPSARLTVDARGVLYGTTELGGYDNKGVVFKLTPTGSGYAESVIHHFDGLRGGAIPTTGVTLGKNGVLYGTAEWGGHHAECFRRCGIVFRLTPSSSGYRFAVIHLFSGSNGENPAGRFLPDGNGGFFGTAATGGAGGEGVVFHLSL